MTLKTKLKFYISNETGKLVSFVSITKTNKLKGVREDSNCKKKICVLSSDLAGTILPNTLYNVGLVEMRSGKGYIVVSADPVLFDAKIEDCVIPKVIYKVSAKFGNKTIFFDPIDGESESSRTLEGALKVLEERNDIADKELVIADFKERGVAIIRKMQNDGYYVKAKAC